MQISQMHRALGGRFRERTADVRACPFDYTRGLTGSRAVDTSLAGKSATQSLEPLRKGDSQNSDPFKLSVEIVEDDVKHAVRQGVDKAVHEAEELDAATALE
jgi:hypothetical protein